MDSVAPRTPSNGPANFAGQDSHESNEVHQLPFIRLPRNQTDESRDSGLPHNAEDDWEPSLVNSYGVTGANADELLGFDDEDDEDEEYSGEQSEDEEHELETENSPASCIPAESPS